MWYVVSVIAWSVKTEKIIKIYMYAEASGLHSNWSPYSSWETNISLRENKTWKESAAATFYIKCNELDFKFCVSSPEPWFGILKNGYLLVLRYSENSMDNRSQNYESRLLCLSLCPFSCFCQGKNCSSSYRGVSTQRNTSPPKWRKEQCGKRTSS